MLPLQCALGAVNWGLSFLTHVQTLGTEGRAASTPGWAPEPHGSLGRCDRRQMDRPEAGMGWPALRNDRHQLTLQLSQGAQARGQLC